jgi:hypothetical protein
VCLHNSRRVVTQGESFDMHPQLKTEIERYQQSYADVKKPRKLVRLRLLWIAAVQLLLAVYRRVGVGAASRRGGA